MDALKNILTRNSPRALTTPIPSKDEMHKVYQAALRAPDHAWLRPSRFIEVTGKGLDKLSKIFSEFASQKIENVTAEQIEKYKSAPYRAPMVIVLVSKISDHPKVPAIEQMLSTAAAAQNLLLALHAKNYSGMWRTGKLAFNKKIVESLELTPDHEIIGYLYVGTSTGSVKAIPELEIEKFVTRWNK